VRERIRILEIVDKPFMGGGQIHLLSLAQGLDRDKFDVYVCPQEGGALADELRTQGIKHVPIPFQKRRWRQNVREIASVLEEHDIEIIHTHGGVAGLYGRWAARKCRTPVIVHTLHGIHYLHYRNSLLKRIYIFLERYFSRFTDALVFVSDEDKKAGQNYKLSSEERMVVLKNGIDFSVYRGMDELERQAKIKELSLEGFQPIVGCVARLHRQKGLIYLVRAAEKISQVFPGGRILIVGSGPLKKKLEDEARRLGLENQVWFMGERRDIPQLLSVFDVFVLSSLWEGLPYALMEAAALAKPVVATDVDGVREIVTSGETGLLVPLKSPQGLAQAVITLLQDRDYASNLGRNLKQEVTSRYTLSKMLAEMESLYLRLYEAKNSPRK